MGERHVYEVLADSFLQEGVTTAFGLLGDANMNWATSMADKGCRFIYVRHEHCAVAAATAYARKSGQIGVATVTCGPGLTQIMTALTTAVRANIPLVIFAGEAPLKSDWYNQGIDQAPFVTACGAAYKPLHNVPLMTTQIRDAFLQAQRERRPVVVGVPFDLQNLAWTGADTLPPPSAEIAPKARPAPPNPEDVAETAELVRSARKVIVMAGLGAVEADAGAACRSLAELTGGLLATTLPARGLFHDDPFYLGVAGGFSSEIAHECFGEADLVIAVGASLAHHNSEGGKLFTPSKVLQIDTSPLTVSQGRVAAAQHLRADARLGVEALVAALQGQPVSGNWRSEALARDIAERPAQSTEFPPVPGKSDPRDVIARLEATLPADWQMINSSGHCSFYAAQMPSRPYENFLTIREFGAIGNGTSYAIGVAAACPDATVVLFDGDGSLLMHAQELETIRRHNLNIIICCLNDAAYGSEVHKMRSEGLSEDGAAFGETDLAAMARGFGIGGHLVTDLGDIESLVADMQARNSGAAVWDFPISDRVVSPVIQRAHPPKQAAE